MDQNPNNINDPKENQGENENENENKIESEIKKDDENKNENLEQTEINKKNENEIDTQKKNENEDENQNSNQQETIMNKLIEEINEKCKNLESLKDVREVIKKYFTLEESSINEIKKFNNQHLNSQIYNLLYQHFFDENDPLILRKKSYYERDVLNSFFQFYFTQDIVSIIKSNYSGTDKKEVNNKDIFVKIQNSILINAINFVKKIIKFDTVPMFIFYPVKKLFFSKIEEILIQVYQFKVDIDPFLSTKKFEYLKKQFQDIADGKIEIFDKSFYNKEEKLLFFKVLVLCNWKYINNSENNKKIFYNNLKNYITLIGLKDIFNDVVGEFQKIIEIKDGAQIKTDLDNIKEEILNKFETEEKYLFFIMSFSIMLNGLAQVLMKNKDKESDMTLIPKLKCSAKERQFLIHLLFTFNGIQINYYLESHIYQGLLKSYTKVLYTPNFEKKEFIRFQKLITLLTNLANNKPDDNITLNDLEINVLSNLLGLFIKQKSEIFETSDYKFPINIPIKFQNSLTLLQRNVKSIHSFIKYDIKQLSLIPVSHRKTSSQICILIDGKFSNQYNLPTLNSYFYQNINSNCDFYTYKWQTPINNSEIYYNKKVAKFYGKLLAYIITSRTIFKVQCINLIGYSLGCHVIKHCLIELNKISSKIDTDDILNDVIFIGGATNLNMVKFPNILNNIGGRIINVFSERDIILKEYNEECMGLRMLVNNTPYKTSHSIININLSHKEITQFDYLNHIPRIINDDIILV
jgi:hypothetical protein